MKNKNLILILLCTFLSLNTYAQNKKEKVEFYVVSYDSKTSEFIFVDGVEVFEGNNEQGVLLGTISSVQSCNSQFDGGIHLEKEKGTYKYYARSKDGKNEWRGEYKVKPGEKTRIPLTVDVKKYEYQEGQDNVLFFVLGYDEGNWQHVDGVTVYDGKEKEESKIIGYTRSVNSAASGRKSEISMNKKPGTYHYVAVSGDGKQQWVGMYTIKKGEITKIGIQVDFSKY